MPDGRSKHSATRTTRSGRPAGQARTARRRADAPGTNNELEDVSPEDAERIRRSNRAGDTDDLTLPDYRQRGRERDPG
jgi:hypothetical protein